MTQEAVQCQRAYLLNVDHDELAKQIKTLSKLTENLTNEEYEATIGAIEVLEAIQKQRPAT